MKKRSWWVSIGVAILCILLMWWLFESVILKEKTLDINEEFPFMEEPYISAE